jgi:release factor glutamine methyltransferase
MPTVRELLNDAAALLGTTSPTPALDAQILLQHASGIPRLKIISEPGQQVPDDAARSFHTFINRRAACEPIAYIVGKKEFYGADFAVTPDVLIPRPETELLVEKSLEFLKSKPDGFSILDLGTGSGCIAISLAREMRDKLKPARIVALDKSSKALAVAQKNAETLGVANLVQFRESDWFSALNAANDRFDLIVSNPPYIALGDSKVSSETRFEPPSALYSGPSGLSHISFILRTAPDFLKPGGAVLLETGADQHSEIYSLFANQAAKIESYKDLAGHDRVLAFKPK